MKVATGIIVLAASAAVVVGGRTVTRVANNPSKTSSDNNDALRALKGGKKHPDQQICYIDDDIDSFTIDVYAEADDDRSDDSLTARYEFGEVELDSGESLLVEATFQSWHYTEMDANAGDNPDAYHNVYLEISAFLDSMRSKPESWYVRESWGDARNFNQDGTQLDYTNFDQGIWGSNTIKFYFHNSGDKAMFDLDFVFDLYAYAETNDGYQYAEIGLDQFIITTEVIDIEHSQCDFERRGRIRL